MRRQLYARMLIFVIGCVFWVASCNVTKNTAELHEPVPNDTIATSVFNGTWKMNNNFFSELSGPCRNFEMKFLGAQVSIYSGENLVNDIRGVFKVKDSITIEYIYLPRDVKYLKERYREYNPLFIKKYFYLNRYNGNSLSNDTCQSWKLADLIVTSRYYLKVNSTLTIITADSTTLIFQKID